MPRKKSTDQKTTAAETPSVPPVASVEIIPEPQLTEAERQQLDEIEELKSVTLELLREVQVMKTETARNASVNKALLGLKSDINAAKTMLAAGNPEVAGVEYGTNPHLETTDDCCGCSPCDCISAKCCSFDIIMTHIRATHMQIELMDTNLNPLGKMEVRVFAEVFGKGAVYPSLWSNVQLHKTLLDPGVWQGVYVPIATVQVCKGHPKTFPITLNAVEIDSLEAGVVEALTGLRDEYGTRTELMTLDCCCTTPPIIDVEVQFTGGSAVARGALEGRFTANKICC